MDYRDRNPLISMWEGPCITEADCVFPGNPPNPLFFIQYKTTNDPTTFLGFHGGVTELEDGGIESRHYLVESPENCPLRKNFFTGRITWEDFWYHKGWLIELKSQSVFDTHAEISFVHPKNISKSAVATIRKYNFKSPLQIKYECLVRELQLIDPTVAEQRQAEQELQEFIIKYHSLVDLQAA